jgi:glycerophosphoryl diester phosphodiesterase
MRFLIGFVLFVALAMPDASRAQPDSSDAFLTPSGFDVQGHRGARGLAPENTIPAFQTALDLGVTTLEMDVVISKDNEVVVSHEPWMSHAICLTPDGERIPEADEKQHRILEMTYQEVMQYDCGSLRHPDFPEQQTEPAPKPLLRDVIEMAEDRVDLGGRDRPIFYNVETKSRPAWDSTLTPPPEPFVKAVYGVLEEAGVLRRATLQSFDPRTLKVAHEMDPDLRLALLVGQDFDPGMEAQLQMLGFTPDVYSPDHQLLDAQRMEQATEHGMPVIPWTVNDKETMRRLIDLGVNGLITDYPNRAFDVLRTAGSER